MSFAVGSLVQARGREWVVLPESTDDLAVVRPLGGSEEEIAGIYLPLETVEPASFALPDPAQLGDHRSCRLLRDALRLGFRSSAGPFRSFARLAVEPRPYQLVPLLMALKLDPIRLLIADDVGIGKTIEALLIVRELIDRGEVQRFAVLCPPQIAEQWQGELYQKFHIDAELVLPGTAARLERQCRLGQSIFERYPYTIVSTDFIKSDRHRDDFLRTCPELVVIDEAHTCAWAGEGRGTRHQRHLLAKGIAADRDRHLILVTATPHSGNEEAFRSLLTLLDPDFAKLPDDLSGPQNESHRRRLAAHFVQRRRGDIRHYLQADTPFPEREEGEENYKLTADYKRLIEKVLGLCPRNGRGPQPGNRSPPAGAVVVGTGPVAIASPPARPRQPPRSAPAPPRPTPTRRMRPTRWAGGRSWTWSTRKPPRPGTWPPAAIPARMPTTPARCGPACWRWPRKPTPSRAGRTPSSRRPSRWSRRSSAMATSRSSSAASSPPPSTLPRRCATSSRASKSPPSPACCRPSSARTGSPSLPRPSSRVLVCTDCLSEGINLQEPFNAVIHYDLSWNPTRHEQREGRVDRYGQPKAKIRAVTYYGMDNQIDGIVLNVLLRKHKAIRSSLGVSIPLPTDSDQVIQAVFQGLLLRSSSPRDDKLLPGFDDFIEQEECSRLHKQWEASSDREKRSRTVFAQESIKVEDVTRELTAAREAIGSGVDIAGFTRTALQAYRASVRGNGTIDVDLTETPRALRDILDVGERFKARFELPVQPGELLLSRMHPLVERLANHVLNAALDPLLEGVARRCGVIRTRQVTKRTTLLLVRYRFHIVTTSADRQQPLLAEDSEVLAFSGSPQNAEWLPRDQAEKLYCRRSRRSTFRPTRPAISCRLSVDGFDAIRPHLEEAARQRGDELLEAHRRVRTASRTKGVSHHVEPQLPPDVLGIYIFLPTVASKGT